MLFSRRMIDQEFISTVHEFPKALSKKIQLYLRFLLCKKPKEEKHGEKKDIERQRRGKVMEVSLGLVYI